MRVQSGLRCGAPGTHSVAVLVLAFACALVSVLVAIAGAVPSSGDGSDEDMMARMDVLRFSETLARLEADWQREMGALEATVTCDFSREKERYIAACISPGTGVMEPCSIDCLETYADYHVRLESAECQSGAKDSIDEVLASLRSTFARERQLRCPPVSAVSAGLSSYLVGVLGECGDGRCGPLELCVTCAADCGVCAMCGDGLCNERHESCSTCPGDCGICARCGDGVCNGDEVCATCPADCECSSCGDHKCTGRENCITCFGDCGECPICGDGVCDNVHQGRNDTLYIYKETHATCPEDCGADVVDESTRNSFDAEAVRAYVRRYIDVGGTVELRDHDSDRKLVGRATERGFDVYDSDGRLVDLRDLQTETAVLEHARSMYYAEKAKEADMEANRAMTHKGVRVIGSAFVGCAALVAVAVLAYRRRASVGDQS
eukprot:Opistho-2@53631